MQFNAVRMLLHLIFQIVKSVTTFCMQITEDTEVQYLGKEQTYEMIKGSYYRELTKINLKEQCKSIKLVIACMGQISSSYYTFLV